MTKRGSCWGAGVTLAQMKAVAVLSSRVFAVIEVKVTRAGGEEGGVTVAAAIAVVGLAILPRWASGKNGGKDERNFSSKPTTLLPP